MRIVHGIIILLLLAVIGLQLRLIDVATKARDTTEEVHYMVGGVENAVHFNARRLRASTSDPCRDHDYSLNPIQGCPEMTFDMRAARAPVRSFWNRFRNDEDEDRSRP